MKKKLNTSYLLAIPILALIALYFWGTARSYPKDLFTQKTELYKYLESNELEYVKCRNSLKTGVTILGNVAMSYTTFQNTVRISEIQKEFEEKLKTECESFVATYEDKNDSYKSTSAEYDNQSKTNFKKLVSSENYGPEEYNEFDPPELTARNGGLFNLKYDQRYIETFFSERLR